MKVRQNSEALAGAFADEEGQRVQDHLLPAGAEAEAAKNCLNA